MREWNFNDGVQEWVAIVEPPPCVGEIVPSIRRDIALHIVPGHLRRTSTAQSTLPSTNSSIPSRSRHVVEYCQLVRNRWIGRPREGKNGAINRCQLWSNQSTSKQSHDEMEWRDERIVRVVYNIDVLSDSILWLCQMAPLQTLRKSWRLSFVGRFQPSLLQQPTTGKTVAVHS